MAAARRPCLRRVLRATAALGCALAAAAGPAAPADAEAAPRPFAPSSVWNARVDGRVALDGRSGSLVAELERSVAARAPWINTWSYSVPVYRVGRRQPRVRVRLDTNWPRLARQWRSVPLPPGARPAPGTDGHLVVLQRSTDTLWEFYKLQRARGRWSARWGGRIVGVSRSPGYYSGAERDHGATATSLSLLGGLMTIDELRAGRIDHALAMAVPYARRGVSRWPAQRSDGYVDATSAIPEGTRLRLDPRLDVDTLTGPPIVRTMARAAQRYGIVVRDQSAGVTFYGEDPGRLGINPYGGPTGFFGGQYPNNLLRRHFPWERLQVIRASRRPRRPPARAPCAPTRWDPR